jgi:hypothetical protein
VESVRGCSGCKPLERLPDPAGKRRLATAHILHQSPFGLRWNPLLTDRLSRAPARHYPPMRKLTLEHQSVGSPQPNDHYGPGFSVPLNSVACLSIVSTLSEGPAILSTIACSSSPPIGLM